MNENYATKEDIGRVEGSIRDLALAIKGMSSKLETLILVEDRQGTQGRELIEAKQLIIKLRQDHDDLKDKVNTWIQRGMGAWAVVCLAWALYLRFGG